MTPVVRYLIRRILLTIPVLIGVATLVFSLIHLVPGDPAQAMLGEGASERDIADLRTRLGLDQPLLEQYGRFMRGLVQGDLGTSFRTGQPVVAAIVEDVRAYAGTLPFDEEAARALAARAVDRTVDVEASAKNHALIEGGEPLWPRVRDIAVPTLVLHGTDDPLFPPEHGEALAAAIEGARLVLLDGMGHEVPPRPLWGQVVAAILHHTA